MAERFENDWFEPTGPYEPITTRIRNILQEYKDGVGILKELIQNADDAGATTVKFLVDWRHGITCVDSLFSPGMAECQGPALWAHNNAVFTDKDLQNINKLAAQTKVEDLSKIGRFGLGFTAVYHVTDVPSFVSREMFVIFDPNTHHLQSRIKDMSRPGTQINLAKNPGSLTLFRDQLQPYNGVFGCSTAQTQSDFYYQGTLFRFPFRTDHQASTSNISKTPYDREKIQALVRSLCECASTLLIFSQHVTEVELYELDASCPPSQMRLVLSVKKPSVQYFRSTWVSNEEPFIKQCSRWWQQHRVSSKSKSCTEYPSGFELVDISSTKLASELSGCDREYTGNEMWFVVSASGTDDSLGIARSQQGQAHGLLPCGGAAFVIQRKSEEGSWESCPFSDLSGELFCFLPLSITTGLPLHVNGYFSIMANRVEIWKRTNVNSQPIEVLWNEALMKDALARAYIMLLEEMKGLSASVKNYKFHTLWPSCDDVDMKSWEKLVQKVCSVLLGTKHKLFCSHSGEWLSVSNGFLLGDDFGSIYEIAVDVLTLLGKHVFNIPCGVMKTLKKFDQGGVLHRRTLSLEAFMEQYFFRAIKMLHPSKRDAVVCFGLDRILAGNVSLGKLFKNISCIPVSKKENILVKPSRLIHPYGDAVQLFSEEDHRFPVGNGLHDYHRLHILEKLGMVKDILSWKDICERAQSIPKLGYSAGTERSRKLITYLNNQMHQLPFDYQYPQDLQRVKFIPVQKEPIEGYVLPWKGSGPSSPSFLAPDEVFLRKDAKLIGSSCYVVDTSDQSGCGKLNAKVKDRMGFSSRLPEVKFVIRQLDQAIAFWRKLSEGEKRDLRRRSAIESICQKIYEFFNKKITPGAGNLNFVNELRERDWLFFQGEFVQSKKVAYFSNVSGAPLLFTLPYNYRSDYPRLLEAMEIKRTFDEEDYISALYELQRQKQGSVLTEHELEIAINFISQIVDVQKATVVDHIGKIPLPDTDGILRPSKDVVVNLNLWLKDLENNIKAHEKIPPQTAKALGARSLKNVILKKYSQSLGYGEAFGQREDLTDRLRGILDGYPTDGILKELVQNADDAQASEIHFIYDTRELGYERVITEKETSEEIQGPALCVYNDKPFTKEDLDGIHRLGMGSKQDSGIHRLGMGSKQDSPGTTGKYGIGFNSVYHLTDCPSFLTDDETLVILDPHCRYAPDAHCQNPGDKFTPIDDEFRHKFSDTLDGYLADHFILKGSTMFRFPLRCKYLRESKIRNEHVDIEELLQTFEQEARKSLLFLNHVKKITLSRIGSDNKLQQVYEVETVITSRNEKKRREMAQKICNLKGTPTAKIAWEGISYALSIKDDKNEIEVWLIQQCTGSTAATITRNTAECSDEDQTGCQIPDGRRLGLLPRGGLAARLWTHSSSSGKEPTLCAMVYCFLPLPGNYTSLPVHVNGHFALDRHRRGLWTDMDGKGEKSEWNNFMLTCVLPAAYATLIVEAQKYLCRSDEDDRQLSRYHALFPSVKTDSLWKILAVELYRYLGQTRAKVLPLLVPSESEEEARSSTQNELPGESLSRTSGASKPPVHVRCTAWLSSDQAYFVNPAAHDAPVKEFLHLLVRIGLPVLLHSPFRLHRGFLSANVTSHKVTPKAVIGFLKRPGSNIGQLPRKLETTVFKSVSELSALLVYCSGEDDFGKQLKGLPLLLTQDGCLRVFDPRQPVFGSEFGDLFPTRSHLFVHSCIVHQVALIVGGSEENIVCDFTVRDLSELLSHVLPNKALRENEEHVTRTFQTKGILSEEWLKRLWDFLQNHARPEPQEDRISLECLSEFTLIPTTCGKLVKIKNAKTVLDMTTTGTESTDQQTIRTFLSNLQCPVLNREITFKEDCRTSSAASDANLVSKDQNDPTITANRVLGRKAAVTDRYVAHPHNVVDVLIVLYYMLNTNQLDLSAIDEEEIRDFLKFVQANHKASKRLRAECERIIKCLPFHKALDGRFVSLTGHYTSYALVPSGVPIHQLKELQESANCLFLDSDALPALEKLYNDLGVKGGRNVRQFYVKYVFRYFSVFTRESHIRHLAYIRDEVLPWLPLGDSFDKKIFLDSMINNPCIPDEHGHLHFAREFYDPRKEIFELMFDDERERFPPAPFNNEDWFGLLEHIGLRKDITQQLFLEFCLKVEEGGSRSPNDPHIHKQSRMLVECLFSESEVLRGEKFLSQVSQIEFIAPATVDERLTLLHRQYDCVENGYPPFIKFKKAIPWRFHLFAWTTESVLPDWAEPYADNGLLESLCVSYSGPSYSKVVDHLKNVAASCNHVHVDSDLLHEVTKAIYEFLSKSTAQCSSRNAGDQCCAACKDIGFELKEIPCIFLPEDEIFVKAEQLVFNFPENCPLKPFLYPVPAELMAFTHFLKRLGATEKIDPLTIANVLKALHKHVGGEELSSDEEKQAMCAMYLLFDSLLKGRNADGIDTLYLPTQCKRLAKSSDLICQVPSRYTDVSNELPHLILMRFEECKLKKPSDDYINALHESLRPLKFEDIVREDVEPECKVAICSAEARQNSTCNFQQQFENLLRSNEFQEGLKRLIMHTGQDPEQFDSQIKRLQTNVQIKCIGMCSIKIQLIHRNSGEVLSHSEDSCYAIKDQEAWSLYMQHEFGNRKSKAHVGNYLNKILGDCIQEKIALIAILDCSPCDIAEELNRLDIALSPSKSDFIPPEDDMLPGWDSEDGGGREGSNGIEQDVCGGKKGGRGGRDRGGRGGGSASSHGYGIGYHGGRGGGGGHPSDGDDEIFYPSSLSEAMRWLEQSKIDLEGAKWLLESDPPFSALACFQSHQVAEKCLKAMLFAYWGITGHLLGSHDMQDLGNKVKEETAISDRSVQFARRVADYYLTTRYPNRQPSPVVPGEAFDKSDAEAAIDAATKLLETVKEYLE